jgi:hypothetical protein
MPIQKIRLLLPLALLLVAPMTAHVERAPTPRQCRTDADTWNIPQWPVFVPNEAEFLDLANSVTRDQAVNSKTVDARRAELTACVKVDSVHATRYSQASRAYTIGEMGRMANFIQRHGLMGQFYQEDEQGQR